MGAKPRQKGQERADLLKENAKIFIEQGKALDQHARKSVKVLVVGNPANTNALIVSTHAKGIPRENFCAMTRLDHDRALWQLAEKTKRPITAIDKAFVWGNHSPTMYPDLTYATIDGTQRFIQARRLWTSLTRSGTRRASSPECRSEVLRFWMHEDYRVQQVLPTLPSTT